MQEKQQTIAVLNRELERAQKANAQLSEETMELEQARAEKTALQAQLDKVQDELEDMDRVAEPQGFTDQVNTDLLYFYPVTGNHRVLHISPFTCQNHLVIFVFNPPPSV